MCSEGKQSKLEQLFQSSLSSVALKLAAAPVYIEKLIPIKIEVQTSVAPELLVNQKYEIPHPVVIKYNVSLISS